MKYLSIAAVIVAMQGLFFTPAMASADPKTDFWSNFGVVLLYNQDVGKYRPVKSAKILNGVVVVSEDDNVKVGLGLEFHKYLTGKKYESVACAFGPYVSVVPGTDNQMIDIIGAGLAIGLFSYNPLAKSEYGKSTATGNVSMNILLGVYADPNTRILAEGFVDGEAIPSGATEIEYKTGTQWGFQVGVSISTAF